MIKNKGYVFSKIAIFLICLLPLVPIVIGILKADLGPDPVAYLTHHTGAWALRMLLLTLAVTPLRKLSGWNIVIRFRRMLGLYAFFYASLHLSIYLVLDLRGYWAQIFEDVTKRPFMTVGFVAWLILVPLALTSTQAMMKKLGKNWQKLHQLVYPCAILAVLHFWWLVKSDLREPILYASILFGLLAIRWYWKNRSTKPVPIASTTKTKGQISTLP